MKQYLAPLSALLLAVSLGACDSQQPATEAEPEGGDVAPAAGSGSPDLADAGSQPDEPKQGVGPAGDSEPAAQKATVDLLPTRGNNASGKVDFTEVGTGVQVQATVIRLSEGKHGFHIHENGDCSAPDASSAGGHFNPTGVPHGGPEDAKHHLGDLGNIVADASGRARLNQAFEQLSLSGKHSIIGKAVVVHQGADDLTSQPSGDAGPRIACGEIRPAESQ